MRKKIILMAALFLFFNSNHLAFAQTLRCEGKIIKEGMSKHFVLEHCKDPDNKEEVNLPGTVIEKFYYKRGGRIIVLEIRMDDVTNISWEKE